MHRVELGEVVREATQRSRRLHTARVRALARVCELGGRGLAELVAEEIESRERGWYPAPHEAGKDVRLGGAELEQQCSMVMLMDASHRVISIMLGHTKCCLDRPRPSGPRGGRIVNCALPLFDSTGMTVQPSSSTLPTGFAPPVSLMSGLWALSPSALK